MLDNHQMIAVFCGNKKAPYDYSSGAFYFFAHSI